MFAKFFVYMRCQVVQRLLYVIILALDGLSEVFVDVLEFQVHLIGVHSTVVPLSMRAIKNVELCKLCVLFTHSFGFTQ